jgi:hypothetical protein
VFPLTPALSLGEREKRSQRPGELETVSGSNDLRMAENVQLLFLLSRMRDQDEGERGVHVKMVFPPQVFLRN